MAGWIKDQMDKKRKQEEPDTFTSSYIDGPTAAKPNTDKSKPADKSKKRPHWLTDVV